MSIRLGIAGFGIAAAVTVALEAAGNLQGPMLWAQGDSAPVVGEHLLSALAGALGGISVAVRRAFSTPP